MGRTCTVLKDVMHDILGHKMSERLNVFSGFFKDELAGHVGVN